MQRKPGWNRYIRLYIEKNGSKEGFGEGARMGKKIMVVDDALFMRKVIRKNLEECG